MDQRSKELLYRKGQLAALKLPMDRTRPANPSHRRAQMSFLLPGALLVSLRALSRQEDVGLYATLLAAFKVLLYRYSGKEDIAVCSPVVGHTYSEIDGQLDPQVNLLVMRTDLAGEPTFCQLLGRVREVTGEAYAHQDLPFDELAEELQLELEGARPPLFQVMFALWENSGESARLPEIALDFLVHGGWIEMLDVGLSMEEAGDRLVATLQYNPDLFDAATVERMAGHYRMLLESVVADPDRPISELPLLTAPEMHRLLVEWNDTGADFPRDTCIHELFEAHVERNPEAVAVVCGSQELTYGQLNLRANQLAHYLRDLGVGPEMLVGICMERSLDVPVGMLAVLKAGGAFVPLDPLYPPERLAFMLQDAQVSVLLTHEWLLPRLPAHLPRVVCLDLQRDDFAPHEVGNPQSGVTPGNIAYVIYTSGSTGMPKGVMIVHSALCSRFLWGQDTYHRTPADRVLQHISFSFDYAFWEFFIAWTAGARVVMAQQDEALDSTGLVKLLAEQEVSIAGFVPSMLQAILDAGDLSGCHPLRQVFSGAEVLTPELKERWFQRLGIELYNSYGPTEATIDVTHWPCSQGADARSVPIGRPIGNTQVYILDPRLQPVPVGVPGELCIAGVPLARGYLRRPGSTAEKFIPNPFGLEPGARLYRTGDQARYRPDSSIEYLGRIDQQVKIRGFRIELGEIEFVLQQSPDVRDAVVVLSQDAQGGGRLVAYLVPDQGCSPTISDLRAFLHSKLPEHMIPASYVLLEKLPMTASGKVDRQALPLPDRSRPELEQAFVAPRTPIEEILADIWGQVLGIERIGIHDSFFDLGGHSLQAVQIVSRIRDILQEVPLNVLFESPTVVGMAAFLAQSQTQTTAERELEEMLAKLGQLSDDEVDRLLAEEGE